METPKGEQKRTPPAADVVDLTVPMAGAEGVEQMPAFRSGPPAGRQRGTAGARGQATGPGGVANSKDTGPTARQDEAGQKVRRGDPSKQSQAAPRAKKVSPAGSKRKVSPAPGARGGKDVKADMDQAPGTHGSTPSRVPSRTQRVQGKQAM